MGIRFFSVPEAQKGAKNGRKNLQRCYKDGIVSIGFRVNKTVKRRQGEISAANFFEKINLCVTFYIACASIYQNSEMMVWLWYSVVYNLSLYLCRYSSGATILYPIN